MGKSVAFSALLILLAVAVLFCGHGAVDETKDKVSFEETVYTGAVTASENIAVTMSAQYDYHLFWESSFILGGEPDPITDFSFYPEREYNYPAGRDSSFNMYTSTNFSISGSIDFEDEESEIRYGVLLKPARAIAEEMGEGETRRAQIIRLRDYYDYYPMYVDMYPRSGVDAYLDDEYFRSVADYFKIPVSEDHYMLYLVEKTYDGKITGVEANTVDKNFDIYDEYYGDYYGEIYGADNINQGSASVASESSVGFQGFNASYVFGDGGVYVIFANGPDEGFVDTREIEGGYGIYYIPYYKNYDEFVAAGEKAQVSVVYPLDYEDRNVLCLYDSPVDGQLILLTEEGGEYVLNVIETENMTLLQELRVDKNDMYWPYELIYFENAFIFYLNNERFVLFEADEQGMYKAVIESDFYYTDNMEYANWSDIGGSSSADYDGERLALASYNEYYNKLSFSVLVYDRTGLVFAAGYETDLDNAASVSQRQHIQRCDYDGIKITILQ